MVNLNWNPFSSPVLPPSSEIVSLRVYPIKSCRGFQVEETTLRKRGLELDRQWMFVDAKTRKFLTIRDISIMTLIRTSLGSDEDLIISIDGTDKRVSIPARPTQQWLDENTKLVPAKVWKAETDGYEYSGAINSVFSEFLKRDVCLILKGPTPRILTGNAAPIRLGRTEGTQFADAMPLQIASEASLKELNSRLKKKGQSEITIERFRPNIVIKGNEPWSEDIWSVVRINGSDSLLSWNSQALDIDVACRCARCQVPNVDPETGEQDKHEPWDTLVHYRRIDEGIKYKPCFGMLCVPRSEGKVRVGMKFEVLKTTNDHLYQKGF